MNGENGHAALVGLAIALLVLGLVGAMAAVGIGLSPLVVEQGQSFHTKGQNVLNVNACGKISLQQSDGTVLTFNESGACPFNGTITVPFDTLKNLGSAIQLKVGQWNQRPTIVK